LNGALTGTKLIVEFTLLHQANNLSKLQPLSKKQILIYKLISYMHIERGMSYRKISAWLNRMGIKTHRDKKWGESGNSVYSVLKRMKEREDRIKNVRGEKFKSQIEDFKIQKIGGNHE
jgi:hypothetical protein